MDAVIDPEWSPGEPHGARRVRAFRATDHFAVAVFQAVRGFARAEGETLAAEIRRAVARAGGALVAASGGDGTQGGGGRPAIATAQAGLLEIRYYLYLARRLGCLDLKRYRQLTTLQDAALRELTALLEGDRSSSPFRSG
jgi:23S rRNA-intervening sequence protein